MSPSRPAVWAPTCKALFPTATLQAVWAATRTRDSGEPFPAATAEVPAVAVYAASSEFAAKDKLDGTIIWLHGLCRRAFYTLSCWPFPTKVVRYVSPAQPPVTAKVSEPSIA
eukprot:SAG22_NODE_506_length_9643_cov_5.853206_3_plen_112_part_00